MPPGKTDTGERCVLAGAVHARVLEEQMHHTAQPRPDARPNRDLLADFDESVLSDAMWLLDELSGSAVRLLFHIRGLESCARGLCCAKVRTLAERMGVSDRTVRRRFAELAGSGLVEKLRRRCRTAWRGLTELGRAVIAVVKSGGSLVVSAHLAAHKGVAEPSKNNSPRQGDLRSGAAAPSRSVDPREYKRPRIAACLSEGTWASLAGWLSTARSVSWARCKMAHRAFSGLVIAIHRSREWGAFNRTMCARGAPVSAESLVRLAVDDAVRCGRDFGTVETAVRYVSSVILACVAEKRMPGSNRPDRRVRA